MRKNFGVKPAGEVKEKEMTVGKGKPMSPIVVLMKLKGRAKQGDPRKGSGEVKMDDRLYFTVKLFEKDEEKAMRELWLPKATTAGKALDLFANHFGIENANHLSTTDQTKLLSLCTPTFEKISNASRIDEVVSSAGFCILLRGKSQSS